jgi:hypothetical protein
VYTGVYNTAKTVTKVRQATGKERTMIHPLLITVLIDERDREVRRRVDGPRDPSWAQVTRRRHRLPG